MVDNFRWWFTNEFLPISWKYNLFFTFLHCHLLIWFSYRTLHFEILIVKQSFRKNGYPKTFVDRCIQIYLDKVFIKHSNMSIVPKKEISLCFSISQQKVIRNQKATAKSYWKNFTILLIKIHFRRTI